MSDSSEIIAIFRKHGYNRPTPSLIAALQELYPREDVPEGWMIDNDEMRKMITDVIMPAVMGRWLRKNEDYRGAQMFLGIKAQFIDINRKFWKLYHLVWEGRTPEFETETEIKMDMIGHLLMSLYLEEPARWRQVNDRMQTGGDISA